MRRPGGRRPRGMNEKLADTEATKMLTDMELPGCRKISRFEAAPRATGMMVDPEGNRLEVSPGLTRILADPEATRLTTGFRPAMEAMEFRSLRSAPEVMTFGSAMEEKKYYFSN